jgi:hypothetical protein
MRLDASYNLCSKLGSKRIFGTELWLFFLGFVLPNYFPILGAFSQGGYFLEPDGAYVVNLLRCFCGRPPNKHSIIWNKGQHKKHLI